jgi:NAD(P)-dependent dehydrogenase (short-subunit alcohol dehydrogenase family)
MCKCSARIFGFVQIEWKLELIASSAHSPLQDTDTAYYDKMMSIMQRSIFLAVRYGGQAMCNTTTDKPKPSGSIIVTSSMASVSGAVSDISYCKFSILCVFYITGLLKHLATATAKAAAANMVRPAAIQLSASNIRVNSISPGFVRSSIVSSTAVADSTNGTYSRQDAEKAFNSTMGLMAGDKYYYQRIPEPEEIAHIGVFLASDLSASINAQNIVADSGKTASGAGEGIIGPVAPLTPLLP